MLRCQLRNKRVFSLKLKLPSNPNWTHPEHCVE